MNKNRYLIKNIIDLGPTLKVKDTITGRDIRHIYIVQDNLTNKILSISENTTIFLISKDMGIDTNSERVKSLWKKIKKVAKRNLQRDVMTALSFMDVSPQDKPLAISFISQISKGRPLSKKQLNIINFKSRGRVFKKN